MYFDIRLQIHFGVNMEVKVSRDSSYIFSLSRFQIFVNDNLYGEVENGKDVFIDVSIGDQVVITLSMNKSSAFAVKNDTKVIFCGTKIIGWKKFFPIPFFFIPGYALYVDDKSILR